MKRHILRNWEWKNPFLGDWARVPTYLPAWRQWLEIEINARDSGLRLMKFRKSKRFGRLGLYLAKLKHGKNWNSLDYRTDIKKFIQKADIENIILQSFGDCTYRCSDKEIFYEENYPSIEESSKYLRRLSIICDDEDQLPPILPMADEYEFSHRNPQHETYLIDDIIEYKKGCLEDPNDDLEDQEYREYLVEEFFGDLDDTEFDEGISHVITEEEGDYSPEGMSFYYADEEYTEEIIEESILNKKCDYENLRPLSSIYLYEHLEASEKDYTVDPDGEIFKIIEKFIFFSIIPLWRYTCLRLLQSFELLKRLYDLISRLITQRLNNLIETLLLQRLSRFCCSLGAMGATEAAFLSAMSSRLSVWDTQLLPR